MKKIILLVLALLMMTGCDEINKISNEIKEGEKTQQVANTAIQVWHNQIVIIDSCEYISEETRGLIEHKGNCRFCKERRQNELKELVEQLKK